MILTPLLPPLPPLLPVSVLEKDLSSAKSVFEQMKAEKVTVNELTLKRLASLYTEAGETPPFTEPPVRLHTHTPTT